MKFLFLCLTFCVFAPHVVAQNGEGRPYIMVSEVIVAEGQADNYQELMHDYLEGVKERPGHNGPDLTFRTSTGSFYHAEYISSLGDIDGMFNSSMEDREYLGESMNGLMGRYFQIVDNSEDFVVEYHEALSYAPESEEGAEEEALYATWLFFDFDFEHYGEVMELAAQMRQMQMEAGTKVPSNLFTNVLGGPAGQLIVQRIGVNEQEMNSSLEADAALLASPEYEAWQRRVEELLGEPEVVSAELLKAYSEAYRE